MAALDYSTVAEPFATRSEAELFSLGDRASAARCVGYVRYKGFAAAGEGIGLQLWSLDESSAQAATSNSFLTASARFARMIARTNRKTLTFKHPFFLKAVDRTLPPGDYQVVTDEELIDGLSFPVYRRVSTMIFVPGQSASSVEMVTVDPLDLQAAHDRDAQEA